MANEEKLREYLKLVTANLKSARRQLRELSDRTPEPIAVVGIGCRFPGGVRGPDDLWQLVADGTDAISDFPDDRGWDADSVYDGGAPDDVTTRTGGFLDGATDFDAAFFDISPREALAMDPQQRVTLEVAWEALEHAGIAPRSLNGSRTGVYMGVYATGYGTILPIDSADGHMITGMTTSVLSGRLSFALGLQGPAISLDTACSSSLVSVHLAARALRAGETDLALAGGVTVLPTPTLFAEFSRQQGLAADGRCKAFSDSADGTGWGEGVGLLVLERLSDARRLGHRVLAVVTGSAVNSDGASNGLTAPNGPSQRRVIEAALEAAGLTPADIDAVEAHGTGTALGDPIEAQALLQTYGRNRPAEHPLWLGSLKSNLGHTQAAAGVAGLIKMIMSLRNGTLPRTLHAHEPSRHVDWDAGSVRLLTEPVAWPAGETPRRAAISGFGISGTNAHVILEEAPAAEPDEQVGDAVPVGAPMVLRDAPAWLVSARSTDALAAQARALKAHLHTAPAPDLRWSLATTRSALEHRAVVVGADPVGGLAALAAGAPSADLVTGEVGAVGRTVLVFPGQGGQWLGMGRELAEVSPVFAERLAECCAALAPHTRFAPEEMLAGTHGFSDADVVQPVLWAVMVSLAELWRACGLVPDAVLGHSQGEIAAAVVAGALTLDDGARVVALRSRSLRALSGRGGMLSIAESADAVTRRIAAWPGRLSVAAKNSPVSTVVSGDPEALAELVASCPDVRTRFVGVDYASHSAQVDDLRADILTALASVAPRRAQIPMLSALTGTWLAGPELDAAYWYASLREPVEFERAVRALGDAGYRSFIESSPHPVLVGAVTDTLPEETSAIGTLRRDDGGAHRVLLSLAEAHVHGLDVDWRRVLSRAETVDLPTYAFRRRRFWPTTKTPAATAPVDRWRYEIRWADISRTNLRGTGTALPAASLHGTWLLVTGAADATGYAEALAAGGAEVVPVVLPDAEAGDRRAVAARLPEGDFAGVVSLLALDEDVPAANSCVPVGLLHTLALVQALGDRAVRAPLWVLTEGAVAARPGEAPRPYQAQAWGLGRVIGLEHPDRWGGLIDLGPDLDARTLCAVLADGTADEVALRPDGVLVRRLERATIRPAGARPAWTPRGTVLVTGGSGSIGSHLLPWLAERGARRLVLPTRRGATPAIADAVARLAAAGTAVDVVACDIADAAQTAALVAGIGDLTTVIHAATAFDLTRLNDTAPHNLAVSLGAKVAGAQNLHAATDDLDDFVLFSSIAATWGSNEHAAYGAANAHLDALAQTRHAQGLPALSIAWGVWDTRDWESLNATAEPGTVSPDRLRRLGTRFLPPARALAALGDVLTDRGDDGHTVLADMDWDRFVPVFTAARPRPLFDAVVIQPSATEPDAPVSELSSRLSATAPGDRLRVLTELVSSHAAATLGHTDPHEVSANRAFRELGFDSLTAVDLRRRLAAATGLTLASSVVFDYPTPTALAERLLTQLLGSAEPAIAPVIATADPDEPIAIVGIGCRFPGGVDSPESYWQLLAAGTDAISGFPTDRGWDSRIYDPDPDRQGRSYTRAGGFLHNAADFDAGFFSISPREALAMDPQQRLLLETSWEALERAGIDPESVRGSATGVFVGAALTGYGADLADGDGGAEGYLVTGNSGSIISGRVAYALGLEGPAITVDTACSSSLVALHLAVRALHAGECSLALTAGVMTMATPGQFVGFSRQRGLSPDGRCRAFGAGADGMGLAEGVGVIAVERLSDARRNGHPVLALVRGIAMNQDGASNGLTAPNGPAQQRVILAALANAGLQTGDVDAVEAHGTGTTLGDPIEAHALLATYGQDRTRPLWLGSAKSNIGHTQTAAGMAGLIKMVLALRHRELPRTLHAEQPSPEIDWASGNVELLTRARPWESAGTRRAGVSAFGMSGTNVHVIVEEAPDEPASAASDDARALRPSVSLWPLSARSPQALLAQAGRLREFVLARPDLDPADIGWSLAADRAAFDHRAMVLGHTRDEMLARLPVANGSLQCVTGRATGSKVVFVFPGQGSQWVGMGRELLVESPEFATRFAECAAALESFIDWSVADVLLGVDGAPDLAAAHVMQPVLWAVMVSLAAVWQASGVAPDVVLGHSQGEIAAAVVAGILTLEDGARVVAVRSRALTDLDASGGMVSVVMPVDAVRPLLEPWGDRLAVAAVNGPATTVVSGESDALTEFERELRSRRVLRWRLPAADFVAHSRLVEPIAPVLERELADLRPVAGNVAFFSTVHARVLDGTELDGAYWYANVRRPVRFSDAVQTLAQSGHRVFVEVSAHPVLTAAITETVTGAGLGEPVVTGTVEREQGGADRFLASLAVLAAHGVDLAWARVLRGTRVELPTYAFEHSRYWPSRKAPAAPVASSTSDMADRFWHAVEHGDVADLVDTLELPGPAGLDAVLPALSSWRRRERGDAETSDWRHGITWRPVPDATPAPLHGTWLVMLPQAEAEHPCVADLSGHGAVVVTAHLPARSVDRAGLAKLISTALGDRQVAEIAGVLSLAALDETPEANATVGLLNTLAVTQALGDCDVAAPLWLVTRGAVTGGTELSSPQQAPVWGFGLSAALEMPDRWGGLVDLPLTWDERAGTRLRGVLTAGQENQVALRGSGILARRLVRVPLPAAPAELFVPRGSVLITGGTGAIGARVARWLSTRGTTRLVLTSRSGAAADGTALLAAQLAQAGTAVEVVACDSGDRDALVALLARIAATGPTLSSVFHAAGALDDGVIDRMSPQRLADALRGKAAGARYLDELTADLDLDAFVLFSSTSATFGNGGQSNYAAANAYLDALAEQRFALGKPALSVAWGPWDGGGVGQASEGARQRLARNKWEVLMDPDLAVRALGRAIEDPTQPTLTMMAFDLSAMGTDRGVAELLRAPFMSELAVGTGPDTVVDVGVDPRADLKLRLDGRAALDRVRELTTLIRAEAAWVMGYDDAAVIDATKAFSEMGLDSLTSVELRNRLASATGLTLPATLLFDYPDPVGLAAFLDVELHGDGSAADTVAASGIALAVDPLAVVGMGCRFPGGVRTPEQLWALLDRGGDSISGLPTDRGWDLDGLYDPDPDRPGTAYVREGGFLTDVADFDANFFGISPREALAMDPQQRLLLEVTWEALEQGGINPMSLRGSRTGVFVGGYISGYDELGSAFARTADGVGLEGHLMTGNATSVLSGRVSYLLGLEGPAMTIDTACSSSLVALHSAVSALRAGECDLALAGGVTVMATPRDLIGFSRQRGLAADGRCKAFGSDADGMGMAEGAGVIAVERLSDARRNGHRVLGLIRGSAVNQDGASNGLTAPNGPSQQRVIRAALADAGLTTADIDVVEAHGTGTPLGDPIEAGALLATYGHDRTTPVRLGSVKSNLGHTQAAAGVAGVLKVLLALRHDRLPATLHAGEASEHIDWSSGALQLLTEPAEWAPSDRPRRAGVSAFGMSGTNAHVILEQAPMDELVAVPSVAPVVTGLSAWPLSARDAEALAGQARRLREHVLAEPSLAPADVARSLATTRSTFEHGAVVLGADLPELTTALTALATGVESDDVVTAPTGMTGKVRTAVGPTAFVFPGQGSQWVGMGRELAATSPVFAARLAECGAALAPYVNWTLTEVLFDDHALDTADVVQPALWAVMVSLAKVWQAAGVEPDAVLGHSQGEIAAAVVAGALTLEDGAKVVALRSRALTALAGHGGMLSITEPADAVRARIAPWGAALSLAAVNGPNSCVVSGAPEALRELAEMAAAAHLTTKLIGVDYASHSAQVDAIAEEILALLDGISPRPATRLIVSAMTGELLDGTELGARYWVDSLRAPVEFARAVRRLVDDGYELFVEVSPHPVLRQGIEDTADVVVVDTLRRRGGGHRLLRSLATAALQGAGVNWPAVFGGGAAVELPTYAFRHQRFWPQSVVPAVAAADDAFWAAVDAGDAGELADALAVDDARVADLLPALAAYRRRERDDGTLTDWRYRVTWAPVADAVGPAPTGRWLVVGADADTAAPAAALAAAGADVVTAQTFDAADTAGVTGIVSLLALDAASGLFATLRLVQSLDDTVPLWVVTRGGVATGPAEVTAPEQAQVWGLGRVIALEHPQRWGGLIDLPDHWDAPVAARFVRALNGTEDQVALRTAGTLGRRLTRAGRPRIRRHWQARGTVLVTGGLGALGAYAARWATDRGAERVLLTAAGPLQRDVAVTAAGIAGAGGDVVVAGCDNLARSELSNVLRRTATDGPALTAVIHADGRGQATPVADMTEQELTAVTAAKVGAAELLDDLTEDLDAFVVFSSIAATWGSARVGGYAAGNAFVEAIAERRRARGLPATTVAWGPWETGTASDSSVRHGLRTLDPALAMRALGQMLDGGEDALTIADVDWQRFAPAFTLHRPSPLVQELPEALAALAEPVAASMASTTRWAELPRARREQELTELVRIEAARVLAHSGPADVDPDRAFSALGFDSLTSVELRNRLTAATGVVLPSTMVFQFPTPHELAVRLCELTGGDDSPDAALAELDRLDAVLDGLMSEPGAAADRVNARLDAVMARWRKRRGEPVAPSGIAGQLAAAGDEEMFEFLGKEFGIE